MPPIDAFRHNKLFDEHIAPLALQILEQPAYSQYDKKSLLRHVTRPYFFEVIFVKFAEPLPNESNKDEKKRNKIKADFIKKFIENNLLVRRYFDSNFDWNAFFSEKDITARIALIQTQLKTMITDILNQSPTLLFETHIVPRLNKILNSYDSQYSKNFLLRQASRHFVFEVLFAHFETAESKSKFIKIVLKSKLIQKYFPANYNWSEFFEKDIASRIADVNSRLDTMLVDILSQSPKKTALSAKTMKPEERDKAIFASSDDKHVKYDVEETVHISQKDKSEKVKEATSQVASVREHFRASFSHHYHLRKDDKWLEKNIRPFIEEQLEKDKTYEDSIVRRKVSSYLQERFQEEDEQVPAFSLESFRLKKYSEYISDYEKYEANPDPQIKKLLEPKSFRATFAECMETSSYFYDKTIYNYVQDYIIFRSANPRSKIKESRKRKYQLQEALELVERKGDVDKILLDELKKLILHDIAIYMAHIENIEKNRFTNQNRVNLYNFYVKIHVLDFIEKYLNLHEKNDAELIKSIHFYIARQFDFSLDDSDEYKIVLSKADYEEQARAHFETFIQNYRAQVVSEVVANSELEQHAAIFETIEQETSAIPSIFELKIINIVDNLLKDFVFFNFDFGNDASELDLFNGTNQVIREAILKKCRDNLRFLQEKFESNEYSSCEPESAGTSSASESDDDVERHKLAKAIAAPKPKQTALEIQQALEMQVKGYIEEAYLDSYIKYDLFDLVRSTLLNIREYRDTDPQAKKEIEKIAIAECKAALKAIKTVSGTDYEHFTIVIADRVERACDFYYQDFYKVNVEPFLLADSIYKQAADDVKRTMESACGDSILSLKKTHAANSNSFETEITEIIVFCQVSQAQILPFLEANIDYSTCTDERKRAEILRYVELQYQERNGSMRAHVVVNSNDIDKYVREALEIQNVIAVINAGFDKYLADTKTKYKTDNQIYGSKLVAISAMRFQLNSNKNLADRIVDFHRVSQAPATQKIISSHQDENGKKLLAFLNYITFGLLHGLLNGRVQVSKGWQSESAVVVDTAIDKVTAVEKFVPVAQRLAPEPQVLNTQAARAA